MFSEIATSLHSSVKLVGNEFPKVIPGILVFQVVIIFRTIIIEPYNDLG